MSMNLIEDLKSLITDERRITAQILEHLEQIESRRLYFEHGYSSLYQFLRHECHYSEGQAYRRIEAMRVTRGEPEAREKIRSGVLNVSVLATASRFLKKSQAQKKQVLTQLEHKSQKETLELFMQLDPERALKKKLTLELTPTQTEKLEQVRAFLSHQNPGLEFEGLLEKLCDDFLKRKSVQRTDSSLEQSDALPILKEPHSRNPRQIALNLRKALFHKAAHRCEHIHMPSKVRCPETRFLELDHIKPVAQGGTNQPRNLRVLCRQHNQAR